jgi:hypothetical protein
MVEHFIGFGFLKLFDSIVGDLNLERMFKFKSKFSFFDSLVDRQPTQPRPSPPSPLLLFLFPTRVNQPARAGPAQLREPSRLPFPFPPGAADGLLPLAHLRRDAAPRQELLTARLLFPLFLPRPRPRSLRHLPSARPCPRSATARRNRPRALLFSPASAARAAEP